MVVRGVRSGVPGRGGGWAVQVGVLACGGGQSSYRQTETEHPLIRHVWTMPWGLKTVPQENCIWGISNFFGGVLWFFKKICFKKVLLKYSFIYSVVNFCVQHSDSVIYIWSVNHSVVSDAATPWTVARQAPLSMNSSGKSTRVGCHALLPTQELNPGRLHCRWILYCLSYWESSPTPTHAHTRSFPLWFITGYWI